MRRRPNNRKLMLPVFLLLLPLMAAAPAPLHNEATAATASSPLHSQPMAAPNPQRTQTASVSAPTAATSAKPPVRVLVLYDSLGIGTAREGNVDMLTRLLASYSAEVTLRSFDSYEPGMLRRFTNLIAVRNSSELPITNAAYLTDYASYRGSYLHIGEAPPAGVQTALGIRPQLRIIGGASARLAYGGFTQTIRPLSPVPTLANRTRSTYGSIDAGAHEQQPAPFAIRKGPIAYQPYLGSGDISGLTLAGLLKDWLGVTTGGHTILVFKEIYPFSDLDQLMRLADRLYDNGIPFAISVRPVFRNTDYPAMKRYAEALQYVQAKNGAILVNAPAVTSTVASGVDTLPTLMADFIDTLAACGIVPLGLGADSYWAYDRLYAQEGMGFFDSAILFPGTDKPYRARTDTSRVFASSHYSMPFGYLQQFAYKNGEVQTLPMNTAVTCDFSDDPKQLDTLVKQAVDSGLAFADYRDYAHQVRTDTTLALSQGGSLMLNGSPLNPDAVIGQIGGNFAGGPEQTQSFTRLLSAQNKIFILLIVFANVAFIGFLMIGSRLYRRKYLK